jgi:D-inositol-3-phosphate glycosyltransferase
MTTLYEPARTGERRRIAMISMHTSPLAALGGPETGGMNVHVREVSRELGARGYAVVFEYPERHLYGL